MLPDAQPGRLSCCFITHFKQLKYVNNLSQTKFLSVPYSYKNWQITKWFHCSTMAIPCQTAHCQVFGQYARNWIFPPASVKLLSSAIRYLLVKQKHTNPDQDEFLWDVCLVAKKENESSRNNRRYIFQKC